MKKLVFFNCLILIGLLLLFGCQKAEDPISSIPSSSNMNQKGITSLGKTSYCGQQTSDLLSYNGPNNPTKFGTVLVANDNNHLYVELTVDEGLTITETHLNILNTVPTEKDPPGHYYDNSYLVGSNEYVVPKDALPSGSTLYIMIQAELNNGSEVYGGTIIKPEHGGWYGYITYNWQSCSSTYSISGFTFFDVNKNGSFGNDETGIPGVTVTLSNGNQSWDVTSDENGQYLFTNVQPGDYTITASILTGLVTTTTDPVTLNVTGDVTNSNFGYFLDFDWMNVQTANGLSHGFWKTNIKKAIDGTTKGTQISKVTLVEYINKISTFLLSPLNITTLQAAYTILSNTSSLSIDHLKLQLLASEFNYMNGAYIGGNKLFTKLFLFYGEYLVKYADTYSSSILEAAKDMYDHYNNSGG